MNCTQAREAMLVAEPAELRGETETALAAHVAGCADCRRAAAMIVGGTTQLGLAIARRAPRTRRRVSRRAIGLVVRARRRGRGVRRRERRCVLRDAPNRRASRSRRSRSRERCRSRSAAGSRPPC